MSDGPFGRRSEPVEPSAPAEPAPAPPAPPVPPRGVSSFTWIVGVAVVLALGYITLNTVRTEGQGSEGVARGEELPRFAAPLAVGALEGDAQVDPDKVCGVTGADVLNSCQLARGSKPVVLGFLASRSEQCEQQIDVLDRVARRHPDVSFAAVAIRGEKADVAKDARRWSLPVAHDRDGAVANLFAVAICPTITFVRPGGVVHDTSLGLIGEAEIERRIAELR